MIPLTCDLSHGIMCHPEQHESASRPCTLIINYVPFPLGPELRCADRVFLSVQPLTPSFISSQHYGPMCSSPIQDRSTSFPLRSHFPAVASAPFHHIGPGFHVLPLRSTASPWSKEAPNHSPSALIFLSDLVPCIKIKSPSMTDSQA